MLRNLFIFLLIFCVGFISLTTHYQVNANDELYLPKKFQLYIGGFLGSSYKVELKDQQIIYQEYARGSQLKINELITPSKEQWKQFWQAMQKIKLWQWQGKYINSGVADGTQWRLSIEHNNQNINAEGSNSYPKDGAVSVSSNSSEPSKVFNQYLAAVKMLLGGKDFQ